MKTTDLMTQLMLAIRPNDAITRKDFLQLVNAIFPPEITHTKNRIEVGGVTYIRDEACAAMAAQVHEDYGIAIQYDTGKDDFVVSEDKDSALNLLEASTDALGGLLEAVRAKGIKVRNESYNHMKPGKWNLTMPNQQALKRERARHSALHRALGVLGYDLRSSEDKDGNWSWDVKPPTLTPRDLAPVGRNDWMRGFNEGKQERAAEFTTLVNFKQYMHGRLDEAGVATHPDGPHSKEGCRIGDRLDIVLAFAKQPPVPPLNVELQRQVDRMRDAMVTKEKQDSRMFGALEQVGVAVYGDMGDGEWKVRLPIMFTPLSNGIRVNIRRNRMCNPQHIDVKPGDPGYDLIYRLYSDTLPRPAKA